MYLIKTIERYFIMTDGWVKYNWEFVYDNSIKMEGDIPKVRLLREPYDYLMERFFEYRK